MQSEAEPDPRAEAAERQTRPRSTATSSAQAEVVAEYRRLAAAAKRGDAQGVASAEAKLQASPVAALAAQYGLHACGTPGGTGV